MKKENSNANNEIFYLNHANNDLNQQIYHLSNMKVNIIQTLKIGNYNYYLHSKEMFCNK